MFETIFNEASKLDVLMMAFMGVLFLMLVGLFIFLGVLNPPSWLNVGKKKRINNHDECELYPVHIGEVKEAETVGYAAGKDVSQIREHDLVYEQMVTVRLYSEQVKKCLFDNYCNLLPDHGLSEKQRSAAKVDYRKDLKIALDEACGFLRKWVKKNHFMEKSDVQFNEYIDMRTTEVKDKVTEVLDTYYLQAVCIVDREELRKANEEKCFPAIKDLVKKMFFEIREISENKEGEIQDIKRRMKYYGKAEIRSES